MPLTHVCVWDSKIGYRRITVEEACKMYPYGASARSGHFVCELCAQNVLLTASVMIRPLPIKNATNAKPLLIQTTVDRYEHLTAI